MRQGNALQPQSLAMLALEQELANRKQGRHPVCVTEEAGVAPPVRDGDASSALTGWISRLPEHTQVDQVEMVRDSGHVLKSKVAQCDGDTRF